MTCALMTAFVVQIGSLLYDDVDSDFCEETEKDIKEFQGYNPDMQQSFMLVDGSDCSFVSKVRNVEETGAGLAIIIYPVEQDVNITNIVMSDDRTGSGIRIPSVLISKTDGDILWDFMETASEEDLRDLKVLATFEMNNPDNRVEYDFWYSSSNDIALDFLHSFYQVDKRFGDKVKMTPRFVFWECKDCEDDFKNEHCFSDGNYCAIDSG